jgi:hypothetical protein
MRGRSRGIWALSKFPPSRIASSRPITYRQSMTVTLDIPEEIEKELVAAAQAQASRSPIM